MKYPTTSAFATALFAAVAVSIGVCVTPILISNCPTWTAYLTVPIPLLFAGVLFYIQSKHVREKEILLRKVDDNVRNFLFNNGEGSSSDSLTELNKNLKQATTLIKQIGEGNFEASYPGMNGDLREFNRDNLSGELLQMKDRMVKVAEEEKQRSWVTSGLAHFSEIVRAQNKSFEEIINHFISELVKYMGANQGGIFIVNNNDPQEITLDLVGCFAYGRRKHIQKKVTVGEGLVGQTYIEGDIIYLTDVPTNYVTITSGLGEATPRCVILVPLKNHEVIEGVVEIASFRVWEKFESDFVIKVAEILGSAIASIKTNEQTKRLLAESQAYAQQLKVKEEEMRQGLEELNATQEAMAVKSQEALIQNNKLNAVLDSAVDAIVTLNDDGQVESVNKAFTHLFAYTEDEIIDQPFHKVFSAVEQQSGKLISLRVGDPAEIKNRLLRRKDGTEFHGEVVINAANLGTRNIFTCIIRDITERIKAEQDQHQYIEELRAQEEELKQNMEELEATQDEIQRQMKEIDKINSELNARVLALNTTTIISESDLFGNINYINDKFCEVSQYSREELIGEPHNMLRHPDMPKEVFAKLWSTIKAGQIFRGIVKNRKKDGSHYWVDAVISPVLSEEGKPLKYIGIRYVIDDEEFAQRLFDKQLQTMGLLRKERVAIY